MNIITASREFTVKEIYNMTRGQHNLQIKQIKDGEVMHVTGWLKYEDVNSSGAVVPLLAIETDMGIVAGSSPTFEKEFFYIAGLFDNKPGFDIAKVTGVSKNGRTYHSCELA